MDRPGWIEALFRSGIGLGNFGTPYFRTRQALTGRIVQGRIPAHPGAADELRRAAREELDSPDPARVERALAFLLVVGQAADAASVEPLNDHPEELLRKAARACAFALRRRCEADREDA
jgi:hypothetical protein